MDSSYRMLRNILSDIRLLCLICIFAYLNCGCAALPADADPELVKMNRQTFTDHNPMIASEIAGIEFATRMATLPEIPRDHSNDWLVFSKEGAEALGLGLVAPPMYASGLVVGGALLLPLGVYGYMHDKGVWNSINTAMINFEFTKAINDALQRRLDKPIIENKMQDVKADIIIHAYGLERVFEGYYCLMVSTKFILTRNKTKLYKELFFISHQKGSTIPPQCTFLDHFAEEDARLITDTLSEYVELLAVLIKDRLSKITI